MQNLMYIVDAFAVGMKNLQQRDWMENTLRWKIELQNQLSGSPRTPYCRIWVRGPSSNYMQCHFARPFYNDPHKVPLIDVCLGGFSGYSNAV